MSLLRRNTAGKVHPSDIDDVRREENSFLSYFFSKEDHQHAKRVNRIGIYLYVGVVRLNLTVRCLSEEFGSYDGISF